MIFVSRTRTDATGQPIAPRGTWLADAAAQTAVAVAEGEAHRVTDLYQHPNLKAALEELFHHKCAYCESPIGAEADWNVEHYRPKGRVAERTDHPGYYWLAYTWTNLYLSCAHCNQWRKDVALYNDPTTRPAQGKVDQFPLAEETARAMRPEDDLAAEAPLLLDANVPDPEAHLAFNPLGEIGPRKAEDLRALATIHVCNLNRRRLALQRRRAIALMVELLRAEARHPAGDEPTQERFAALRELLRGDAASYAAAARAVERDPAAFGV